MKTGWTNFLVRRCNLLCCRPVFLIHDACYNLFQYCRGKRCRFLTSREFANFRSALTLRLTRRRFAPTFFSHCSKPSGPPGGRMRSVCQRQSCLELRFQRFPACCHPFLGRPSFPLRICVGKDIRCRFRCSPE